MERRYTTGRLNFRWAAAMAGLLVAMVAVSHSQIPPGWEIIEVTNDSYPDGLPSINNCGQIVFVKRLGDNPTNQEIFLWAHGVLTRITDDDIGDASPDINDHGTIVWSRKDGLGDTLEIVQLHDNMVTYLTENGIDDLGPEINDLEHVSWYSYTALGCDGSDVYLFDGNTAHQITNDLFSNQGLAMNGADDIAWTRYNFCETPWKATIMLGGLDLTTPLTSGLDQVQGAQINNLVEIVWQDVSGVNFWKRGVATQLTDWGSNPDINDSGLIVFSRWHADEQTFSVWTLREGELSRITDEPEWNGAPRVNNAGEIVWIRGPIHNRDVRLLTWSVGNADHDFDGDVDLVDASPVLSCVAEPQGSAAPCRCHRADLDHDGEVNLRDYALLQLDY